MAAFFEYVRNITYYLLFAALAGMAVPSGPYQKYVRLVTGLVLVCLLLRPLLPLVEGGLPVTELFAGIVSVPLENPSGEAEFLAGYEAWQYETLKTAFDEQLDAQLNALLSQNGYEVESADFACTEDFSQVERVTLTVRRITPKSTQKPFIYIEPVRVGGGADSQETDEDADAVKKIISDFYKLSAEHIHVKVYR